MLTKNFSLSEFTVSETAERKKISNTPDAMVLDNLQRLAEHLELVRDELGQPLHITSGYRSPELNHAIGGAPLSAHTHGLAADFICHGFDPAEVCRRIMKTGIPFDQMIHEYKWTHFAISEKGAPMRRQLLTRKPGGGYVTGLL